MHPTRSGAQQRLKPARLADIAHCSSLMWWILSGLQAASRLTWRGLKIRKIQKIRNIVE
jgi:hypothetical protein